MDILRSLDQSSAVAVYEIQAFRAWPDGGYFKIEAKLVDGSTLHAREYIDGKERCYSFHWQDKTSKLRVRWDNAPHHAELSTFPHHRHDGDKVSECTPPTLKDVLVVIETKIL